MSVGTKDQIVSGWFSSSSPGLIEGRRLERMDDGMMLKDDGDPCAEPNADGAEGRHRNCTKAHKKERDPHRIARASTTD
jgi:hypothetical protein